MKISRDFLGVIDKYLDQISMQEFLLTYDRNWFINSSSFFVDHVSSPSLRVFSH